MSDTFYLKYRSKNLDELDLKEVRESLTKIIKSGKIPHAFLFSGPKGTGKTSAARIIAKILNCENRRINSIVPCDKCDQCKSTTLGNNLDVIELDAASHRGIDDIRALREAVKLSPSKAKKKVYIIDESHMLTTEASNALLKTLEEPPDHVVFILATTNPEKLIPTIRSRTTNILFNKANTEEIKRCLQRVMEKEKIKADNETLELIANSSDGSFRDAIKILEQLKSEGSTFKEEDVEAFLKKASTQAMKLLELLSKKDLKESLKQVEKTVESGVLIKSYTKDILEILRKALLSEIGIGGEKLEGFNKEELIDLIQIVSEKRMSISDSLIEELPLELAIIQWCSKDGEVQEQNKKPKEKQEIHRPEPVKLDSRSQLKKNEKTVPIQKNLKKISDDVWNKILISIKPINMSIEALLRAAKPIGFDGKDLTLGVFYEFHKERLEEEVHKRILEDVVEKIFGLPVRIKCMLTEPPKRKTKEKKQDVVLTESKDEDIIKVAEEIFSN